MKTKLFQATFLSEWKLLNNRRIYSAYEELKRIRRREKFDLHLQIAFSIFNALEVDYCCFFS